MFEKMTRLLWNLTSKQYLYTKCSRNIIRCFRFQYVRSVSQLSMYKNINDLSFHRCQFNPVYLYSRRFYSSEYPSHSKVLLPALSPTMDMGTIVSWAKREGEKLNEGDLLAEIETDKATMGFETPEEGYLAKILVPAGSRDVPIGKLVCIIVENEEDVEAFKDYTDDTPVIKEKKPSQPVTLTPLKTSASAPIPISEPTSVPSPGTSQMTSKLKNDRIFASPLAKKLAGERGLDLRTISAGSGIFGSVKVKDLEEARPNDGAMKAASTADYQNVPLTSVSDIVRNSAINAKKTIPHYYLNVDLSLDEILKLRSKFNKQLEKETVKLSINDFIIKATALSCKKVPEANSVWMDTYIRQYTAVDVCVPVNSKNGKINTVIFDAEKKGLLEINREYKQLAQQAREGTLQPQADLIGTITIFNLGMFNIKSISPILIAPQACILGIGSAQQRLVPDNLSPNKYRVSNIVQFSLSCDHRVIDGAVGALWLQAFRKLIEQPENMLL